MPTDRCRREISLSIKATNVHQLLMGAANDSFAVLYQYPRKAGDDLIKIGMTVSFVDVISIILFNIFPFFIGTNLRF
jgi:hypothetical protein